MEGRWIQHRGSHQQDPPLGEAQVGKAITCNVSYTDLYGTAENRTSNATVLVANVNDAATGSVSISGIASQGQVLTASNTLADADGLGTISYTWKDNLGNTLGTGASISLTEAHVGKAISVIASYTDGHGTAESRVSAATTSVANVNDATTGSVSISGIASQGQVLTASNTLADADGLGTISYTWKDSLGNTLGTGASISLTEAHVGKIISVVASYTDGHGTIESVSSAATANVANVNDAVTGSVSISGVATQGQVLTASNTLADADGLGTISYTWKADGNIIGSGASFTLTEAQVGKTLSVVASYTDGHGTVESVTSAATANVANVNDDATGSVAISGLAEQGQILTASNTLADADGLGTISYTWKADGNIIGSGASFTLTQAQVGKAISVVASYTDGHGTVESRVSASTANVSNINDAVSGTVIISGTAKQGQLLTASDTLADLDGLGAINYTWLADGAAIGTGYSLTLTQAHVGKAISIVASYTDAFGTAESLTSASTASVTNTNDDVTGSVTIIGTAEQGQVLTSSNTLSDLDGLGTIHYIWVADGASIGSGASFTLTQAQVGKAISLMTFYTDGFGTVESVTSESTAIVANINDAATGSVIISGLAEQGQFLTASNTLSDADGLGTISYTWKADGAAIGSGSSLTLTEAQVGKAISVIASYTDGHGTAESRVSAATTSVANVNDATTGSVSISGIASQGQVLTASNTLADIDGLGPISYTWKANGATIGNGTSFILGQAQVGKVVTLVASYTDGHGTIESVTSAATASVANVNDAPTGSVTILAQSAPQTFTSNVPLTFGSNVATISSPITVSSTGSIADINVQINLTHTWMGDVVATLIHPDGTRIQLANQIGGSGDNFNNTIFDQQSVISITSGSAPFVGSFRPSGDLSLLNGKSLNGTWRLELQDVFTAADNGTLNSWSITATTTGGGTQGQTLTATHNLADIDGLGTISYQWKADGSDIAGATGTSLILAQAQVGKAISLAATYLDGFGTLETKISAATPLIANVNDAPTGTLAISGLAGQGQILTANNTLSDLDGLGAMNYQWKANGIDISGATGSSLTLTEAQVGKTISLTASYIDGFGALETKTSVAAPSVINVNDAPTGSVVISGIAEQGQTLTVSNALQDLDGLPVLGYTNFSWRDNEGQFLGYGTSLTLGQNQVGKTISVSASYTDGHGTAESVSSASTAAVANVQFAPTGTLGIGGYAILGQELSVQFGFSDSDGCGPITFNWSDDLGAVLGSYTSFAMSPGIRAMEIQANARLVLTPELAGKVIHLTATYVDGEGKTEVVTANPTAPVAQINILGQAIQGQTLTVDHDIVGIPGLSFRWVDGNGMFMGMGNALTLSEAQVGKAISVHAVFFDASNVMHEISSAATAPVANVNDAPVGAVNLIGNLIVGQSLFAGLSGITDADGFTGYGLMDPSTHFQWLADGQAVGNNAPSLTLSANEAGKTISLQVSYVDAHGTSETITQSLNGLVVDPYDIHIGISGLAEQGQVLTATHTLSDTTGWNFAWLDSNGMFQGMGPTLTLGEAQVGKSLSVRASFWEALPWPQPGVLHESSSSSTATVANVNDAPVGEVTISGTLEVGQNLFAGLAGITDADGFTGYGLMDPSTHFQWLADGQALGNDAPSVTLSTAEAGKHISLQVSYVDAHGTLEQINSALSAMVIDPFA